MQLEHSFTVPAGVEEAWRLLLDVERVAACLPGLTLTGADGDRYRGKIRVQMGRMTVTYTGSARFLNRDDTDHSVTIEATGKEARGAGTATAMLRSALRDQGTSTRVEVLTDLSVSGRPAQFGRGMISDVGSRLVGQLARSLAAQLAAPTEAAVRQDAADVGLGEPDARPEPSVPAISTGSDFSSVEAPPVEAPAVEAPPFEPPAVEVPAARATLPPPVGDTAPAAGTPRTLPTATSNGAEAGNGATRGRGGTGTTATPAPSPRSNPTSAPPSTPAWTAAAAPTAGSGPLTATTSADVGGGGTPRKRVAQLLVGLLLLALILLRRRRT